MDIECAMFGGWSEKPVESAENVTSHQQCHINNVDRRQRGCEKIGASKSMHSTLTSLPSSTSTSPTNKTRSKTASQKPASRRTDNSIQQNVMLNDCWTCVGPTLDRRRQRRGEQRPTCLCGHAVLPPFRLIWLLMCVFLLSTINGAVAARFAVAAAEEGNSSSKGHYTHTWAVHIPGGETVADKIAADHGFVNQGKVSSVKVRCF